MEDVVTDVVDLFNGVNMVGHKNFQYNIVSNPNKAAIISTIIANYVSTNYTMGFSGWNTSRAEVEVGNMIASLVDGWTPGQQGGLFTFGGSGCYLYAMKYAITSVLKDHNPRQAGINVKGRIITSRHGHFCNNISSDWLGVGMDSVVLIDTQPRTNKMCMIDLERKLQDAQKAGEPVFVVVCTMGTTDSMVFDPVDEVHALLDKYPNPKGFGRPHIYCDTVAGWAFLTFSKYDFAKNPLEFSPNVIDLLKRNVEEMSMVKYADSMALDFHKSGYAPVTTSMFVARDGENFTSTLSRPPGHILHHRT
ncbi:MAG: pyridoxal-dependent decarboxylase, partial [Myxococcota bacterium]